MVIQFGCEGYAESKNVTMYEVVSRVVMVEKLSSVYVPQAVAIEFKYKLPSRRLRSASFRPSHQTSPFLASPKI